MGRHHRRRRRSRPVPRRPTTNTPSARSYSRILQGRGRPRRHAPRQTGTSVGDWRRPHRYGPRHDARPRQAVRADGRPDRHRVRLPRKPQPLFVASSRPRGPSRSSANHRPLHAQDASGQGSRRLCGRRLCAHVSLLRRDLHASRGSCAAQFPNRILRCGQLRRVPRGIRCDHRWAPSRV